MSGDANRSTGRFFGLKQVFIFMAMAFVIIMVDLVLLVGIAIVESTAEGLTADSGGATVQQLAATLEQNDDGSWKITDPTLEQTLEDDRCWAALIDEDGTVVWSRNTPDDFPSSLSRNDVAVISHDRMWGDATVFIWTKDEMLAMVGYPYDQFVFWGITLSHEAFARIPLYCLAVFLIDLLIIFLLYVLSQRSVVKNIGPTLDALDNLAQGRPAHVRFNGVLRVVGERINRVSDTLLRKETARKNWVAGVSHDVRTPLAVVMGHAERIEQNSALPQETRDSAAVITRQGVRIRDLIEDLNIATQLEYDMQPLNISTVSLPRLVRDVVADYLNQGLEGQATLELDVASEAAQATLAGDERLLKRALRNAIDNALKHNGHDCTVTVSLAREAGTLVLSIADDGRGMASEQLAKLVETLERDYLGTGSVVAQTPTSATLAAGPALPYRMGQAPAEGRPTPPPTTAGAAYPEAMANPVIASQADPYARRAPKIHGQRPPLPPTLAHEGSAQPDNGIASFSRSRSAQPGATQRTSGPTPPAGARDTQLDRPDATTNSRPNAERAAARHTAASTHGEPASGIGDADSIAAQVAVRGGATEGRIPRTGAIGQHGLGMPLIARIAITHGATFTLESVEGRGFAIVMRFPANTQE